MIQGVPFDRLHRGVTEALTAEDLRRLLRIQFNIKLDQITSPARPFSQQVFDVIETAERAGWLQDLIEAVYRERPRHPVIAELYEQIGLAPDVSILQSGVRPSQPMASTVGFERAVSGPLPILDLDVWTFEATRVADRVCRVEFDGKPEGTGFLVSSDTVLTCDYILQKLIKDGATPSLVQFRFEYKVLSDGTRMDGVVAGLHPSEWLIDVSPHAPGEAAGDTDALPTPDQLGYALVRLARPVGLEPPAHARGGAPRGWIWLPDSPPVFVPKTPVIIAHYPSGRPLKLSIDTQGMIGPNGNGTRVRYQVETEGGSGGSPCFDMRWTVFALHQYSEPAPMDQPKKFRHGIPTYSIRNLLASKGKADALGGPT